MTHQWPKVLKICSNNNKKCLITPLQKEKTILSRDKTAFLMTLVFLIFCSRLMWKKRRKLSMTINWTYKTTSSIHSRTCLTTFSLIFLTNFLWIIIQITNWINLLVKTYRFLKKMMKWLKKIKATPIEKTNKDLNYLNLFY